MGAIEGGKLYFSGVKVALSLGLKEKVGWIENI
jgi:hypothetical protein